MSLHKSISIICLVGISIHFLNAQPEPGDLFREYIWIPDMVEAEQGKFLRVGGRLDYKTNEDHLPSEYHENGYIPFGKYIQLENAIKAELVVEKIESHEDTKGLNVSINKNEPVYLPNSKGIPEPASDYMHHTYPVVDIPLNQLTEGWENSFRLDVDTIQRWDWPQNLIHGVILRIYYAKEAGGVRASITGIEEGEKLGESVILGLDNPDQNIRQVDYIGMFDGINWEGDGIYRQWHYHYLRGQVVHHLGSSNLHPFAVEWNTSLLPDQKEDIKVAARIRNNTNLIYFTEPIEGLTLSRDVKVELVKPYEQPKNWVTRVSEFESKIDITGDIKKIIDARMYWTSWSPCYCNGIYINSIKVFEKEGPCYDYMAHEVILKDISMLESGTNIIKTDKEPLRNGEMVHGMEVQWPGIQLLIRYQTEKIP